MAELEQQERLQPSLLDRLTDNEPEKTQESRDKRVLSVRKLRDCIKRDLAWLLNTSSLSDVQDLSEYPLVEESVLNYGMPDITGISVANADTGSLERRLRQVILRFEPRILKNSLRVHVVTGDEMSANALRFEIEFDMWAEPVPERLYLKTEVDLGSGVVQLTDSSGH
ncbi:MAG TPA: type VI secretion system baseplate subunit TssE [Gammaproteobacteria bacterium]|nr:type VI secretion system baseplate subunit TssE [Gammaproteobacteria bacterium]